MGDNCATTQCMANLCGVPLLGSYSHIAVKNIRLEEDTIKNVIRRVSERRCILKGAHQFKSC